MALTLIGVLHLRFAAPRAVWTPTVNFLGAQGWSFFGGTSASAPMVTGTAGILEALGAGSPANLKYYLTASGDPIVTDQPIGGRRLNAFCAVKLVLPPSHVMDDNFSEGYRDCSRWFTTVEPPGIGLMAVANQFRKRLHGDAIAGRSTPPYYCGNYCGSPIRRSRSA